jgi:DNA polymerase elongation subunit (family B)
MSFVNRAAARLAPEAKSVRILTIDIESRPLQVYAWGLWDQNISIGQIIEHGGMICFAAKWMGDKEVIFKSVHHDGYEAMLESAWGLLSEADVVVTYNGDRYDIKRLNNEFFLAGMTPPKPFKSIDLLKVNKGRFDLPSRKLDYLVQRSGVGAKVKHQGFDLWIDCMAGDEKAWALMRRYNEGDTRITERAFVRLLPWLTNMPHLAMFTGDAHACPYCASKRIKWDGEYTHTLNQTYRLYQCLNCSGWIRGITKSGEPIRTRAIR